MGREGYDGWRLVGWVTQNANELVRPHMTDWGREGEEWDGRYLISCGFVLVDRSDEWEGARAREQVRC